MSISRARQSGPHFGQQTRRSKTGITVCRFVMMGLVAAFFAIPASASTVYDFTLNLTQQVGDFGYGDTPITWTIPSLISGSSAPYNCFSEGNCYFNTIVPGAASALDYASVSFDQPGESLSLGFKDDIEHMYDFIEYGNPIPVGGTLDDPIFTPGTYTFATGAGYLYAYGFFGDATETDLSGDTLTITQETPEPSTVVFVASGLVGLLGAVRRRGDADSLRE